MAYVREHEAPVERTRPSLIRWGAIFGGAVIGLGLLTLLTAFWFALAYGSGISGVRQNLEWYVGISAIVSLFLAGYFAGWLSSTRGWGAGLMNGLTIWGLLLIATVGVGVPALLSVFNISGAVGAGAASGGATLKAFGVSNAPLWATFWSMLGTLVAAGLGGAVGGATPRGDAMYGPQDRERYVRDGEYVDVSRSQTVERDAATR
ncbi:MAG: hypothetical protein ACJ758_07190 [Actinomycetota bacterium]